MVLFLLLCVFVYAVLSGYQLKIIGCKTVFARLVITSNQKPYNIYLKNKKEEIKSYHKTKSPSIKGRNEGMKKRIEDHKTSKTNNIMAEHILTSQ